MLRNLLSPFQRIVAALIRMERAEDLARHFPNPHIQGPGGDIPGTFHYHLLGLDRPSPLLRLFM